MILFSDRVFSVFLVGPICLPSPEGGAKVELDPKDLNRNLDKKRIPFVMILSTDEKK